MRTREDEVDRLLRGGVLVDLFRAVRQGLRASVESYSIKRIEPLYGFERAGRAARRRLQHRRVRGMARARRRRRPRSDILDEIEAYNRDDVVSTLRLRDWLEALRGELADATGQAVPRPAPPSPARRRASWRAADARVAEVAARADRRRPADARLGASDQQRAVAARPAPVVASPRGEGDLLGVLPPHGAGRDRAERSTRARSGRSRSSAGRRAVKPHPRRSSCGSWRYRFPPQDHDIGSRQELYDPARHQAAARRRDERLEVDAEIRSIDEAGVGRLRPGTERTSRRHPSGPRPARHLRRPASTRRAPPPRRSGWPRTASTRTVRGAPRATCCSGVRRARVRRPGRPRARPARTELDAALPARRCAGRRRRSRSRARPGSGKTYTGARMIVALSRPESGRHHRQQPQGDRELPERGARGCRREEGVEVRVVQKVTEDGRAASIDRGVAVTKNNDDVRDGLPTGEFNVVGGNAWLWAPSTSDGLVDVLFVDEAGQMALANVAGHGRRGALDRPARRPAAARPAAPGLASARRRAVGAGAHLLGGHDTMPDAPRPLPRAHLAPHPDVDRVHLAGVLRRPPRVAPGPRASAPPRPGAARRTRGAASSSPTTSGADSASPEEARQVAALVRALVESGSTWVDRDGEEQPLALRGRPRRGALQRPGRRRSRASCPPRRGSARSTSSRARRRRSASTR